MTLSNDQIRNINLIEVLLEEAANRGEDVPDPGLEALSWTEDNIRAYFSSYGRKPVPSKPSHSKTLAREPAPAAGASAPCVAPPPPPVAVAEWDRWFPGVKRSGTWRPHPRMYVLCFPCAGCAEDMYSSEGTGVRKAASALLDWCREAGATLLAVQYPGRAMRNKEPAVTTAKAMGEAVARVVGHALAGGPPGWMPHDGAEQAEWEQQRSVAEGAGVRASYVIVGHSVGTWVAYEFLKAASRLNVPPPKHVFLSAMAAPDLPEPERPWVPQRLLGEEAFKDECRGWDVSDVLFSPALWESYQSILRNDFTIFDQYKYEDAQPFGTAGNRPPLPATLFYGTRDRRITRAMVAGWRDRGFVAPDATLVEIQGTHLWPLDKLPKQEWLAAIVGQLKNHSGHQ